MRVMTGAGLRKMAGLCGLFLVCAGVPAAENAPAPAKKPAEKKAVRVPQPAEEDALAKLAMMPADAVVLEVGEMSVRKQNLRKVVTSMSSERLKQTRGGEPSVSDIRKSNRVLREMLGMLARRGLMLHEIRRRGVTVSDDERARYEVELKEALAASGKDLTPEAFKASFLKTGPSTLFRMTYEDALRVQKLGEARRKALTVSKEEIAALARYYYQSENIHRQHNHAKGETIRKMRQDPRIETSEGFALLAKENSEGKEARGGGELDYDFTRAELADVNGIPSFSWKPGETTPVFETVSCYRVMRVLRDVPPAKGETEPRLRCAQILIGKSVLTDLNDEEGLRKDVLERKTRMDLDEFARSLSKDFPVHCPLFPAGVLPEAPAAGKPVEKKAVGAPVPPAKP